jgi:hypothetical protein
MAILGLRTVEYAVNDLSPSSNQEFEEASRRC